MHVGSWLANARRIGQRIERETVAQNGWRYELAFVFLTHGTEPCAAVFDNIRKLVSFRRKYFFSDAN
jgi:hypothetical protein